MAISVHTCHRATAVSLEYANRLNFVHGREGFDCLFSLLLSERTELGNEKMIEMGRNKSSFFCFLKHVLPLIICKSTCVHTQHNIFNSTSGFLEPFNSLYKESINLSCD